VARRSFNESAEEMLQKRHALFNEENKDNSHFCSESNAPKQRTFSAQTGESCIMPASDVSGQGKRIFSVVDGLVYSMYWILK
jgi:hypothetical protein